MLYANQVLENSLLAKLQTDNTLAQFSTQLKKMPQNYLT